MRFPLAVRYFVQSHRKGSSLCLETCGQGGSPDRIWENCDLTPEAQMMTIKFGTQEMHEFTHRDMVEQILDADKSVMAAIGQDYDDRGFIDPEFAAWVVKCAEQEAGAS